MGKRLTPATSQADHHSLVPLTPAARPRPGWRVMRLLGWGESQAAENPHLLHPHPLCTLSCSLDFTYKFKDKILYVKTALPAEQALIEGHSPYPSPSLSEDGKLAPFRAT